MGLFFSTADFAPIGSRFRRSLADQFGLFEEDESWLNTGWEEPAAEEFTPLAEEYYPTPEEVPAPEPWVPDEGIPAPIQPSGWPADIFGDSWDAVTETLSGQWPQSPTFGTPDWSFLESMTPFAGSDIIDRRPALDPSVFSGISQMLTPWNDDGSRSMGGSFDGIGGRGRGGTWDETEFIDLTKMDGGGLDTAQPTLDGISNDPGYNGGMLGENWTRDSGDIWKVIDEAYLKPMDYAAELGADATPYLLDTNPVTAAPIWTYRGIEATPWGERLPDLPSSWDSAQAVKDDLTDYEGSVEDFRNRPLSEQLIAGTIYDPTNLVGIGHADEIAQGAAMLGRRFGDEVAGWMDEAGPAIRNVFADERGSVRADFGFGSADDALPPGGAATSEEPWRPVFGEPNKAAGAFGDGMTEGGRTTFGDGGSGTLPTPTPGWKMPDPDRFGMATEDQRIAVKDFNNFLEQERVLQATVGPQEISKGRSELAARLEAARKSADKNGLAGEQKANLVEAALREGSLRETLATVPDSVRGEMDYMFDVAMRAYPGLPFENLRAIQTLREAFLTGNLEPRQYDVMRAIFGDVMPDFEKAVGKIADAKNPATSIPMDLGPEFTKPGKPPLIGEEGLSLPEKGVLPREDAIRMGTPIDTAKRYSELPAEMKAAIDEAATLEKQLLGDDYEAWARARSLKRGSGKELSAKGLEKQRKLWIAQLDDALETGAKLDASGREIGPHKYDDVLKAVEARRKVFDLEDQMATVRSDFKPPAPESWADTGGRQLSLIPRPSTELPPGGGSVNDKLGAAIHKIDSWMDSNAPGSNAPDDIRFGQNIAPKETVKGGVEKLGALLLNVWNIPRDLMTAIDMSTSLRQAGPVLANDPKAWAKGMGFQMKAIAHPKAAQEAAREYIATLDSAPIFKERGRLFEAQWGADSKLGKREEFALSNIVQRIPGVYNSGAMGTVMLNVSRAVWADDLFKKFTELSHLQGREITERELSFIEDFVNHATGRGDLPQGVATAGAIVGFSPRNLVSHWQMIGDAANAPTKEMRNAALRSLFAKTIGTALGATVVVNGIAAATGLGETEWDPKKGKFGLVDLNPLSGTFGKANIGPFTYDFFGGGIQAVRPIIRSLFDMAGVGPDTDQTELWSNTVRSKVHPTLGNIWDYSTGYDFNDKKIDQKTHWLNMFGPMSATDIAAEIKNGNYGNTYESLKSAGYILGATPALLGPGVQREDREWVEYKDELGDTWKTYTPTGYAKPEKPEDDPLFMREFKNAHPNALPKTDKGYAFELNKVREDTLVKNRANDEAFKKGEVKTIGDWLEARKKIATEERALADKIRGTYSKEFEPATPGTPAHWLETYMDVFGKSTISSSSTSLDSEALAANMADWMEANGPEAMEYIQNWSLVGASSEVERQYLKDIQQLSDDGYFPDRPNSMPRYIGLASGMTDGEVDKWDQFLSNEKQKEGNEWMKDPKQAYNAAFIVLTGAGLDPLQIQDVLNAGKDKYDHPVFTIYKEMNPGPRKWFNKELPYEVLSTYFD